MNKVKIIIFLLIGILGCQEKNSESLEKKIAEKIAKHIIEKDSLKLNKYSREVFLHIKSEKLNGRNFKTYVSLNSLKSKAPEFRIEKLNINGIETFIYYSLSKSEFNLPEPFFVPDSKSWNFLSEITGKQILVSELKFVMSKSEIKIEELNEIDF